MLSIITVLVGAYSFFEKTFNPFRKNSCDSIKNKLLKNDYTGEIDNE